MLSQVLERLVAFSARDEAELVAARAEWDELAGKVFDDDPLYEERATAFLEWFSLERRGPDGRLPAERFAAAEADSLDELQQKWVQALARSHRSLFEVRELEDGRLLLDDLLGGGAFEVIERRKLPGVAVGHLFEARLVASVISPPDVLFTRAFQFHPVEAAPAMRKLAQRTRAAGEPRSDALFRLMRLRLKALRYGHVAAAKIYAEAES